MWFLLMECEWNQMKINQWMEALAPQQLLSLLHQRQLFVFEEERRKRVGCSAWPPAAHSLFPSIQKFIKIHFCLSVQSLKLLAPAGRKNSIKLISLILFHSLLSAEPALHPSTIHSSTIFNWRAMVVFWTSPITVIIYFYSLSFHKWNGANKNKL